MTLAAEWREAPADRGRVKQRDLLRDMFSYNLPILWHQFPLLYNKAVGQGQWYLRALQYLKNKSIIILHTFLKSV